MFPGQVIEVQEFPWDLNKRKLAEMINERVRVATFPGPDLRHTRPPALPCRDADANAELWFAEAPADVETAKALCLDCPIRETCLAGALERREPWGVWGGELFVQGVVVARKRPRGRPRKHPLPEFAPAAAGAREVAA